jgi:hypothetical protein
VPLVQDEQPGSPGGALAQPHDALFRFVFGKPEAEEVYMSTADMLRAEGRAEGAAKLLVRQLTRKFGPLPNRVRKQIDAASLDQLEVWSDRVLDAPTLDEVFDRPA